MPDSYGTHLVPETTARALSTSFGVAELDALMDQAFARNLDLQAAWSRLRRARAIARSGGAAVWPRLELGGSVSRSRYGASGQAGTGSDPLAGDGSAPETIRSNSEDARNLYQVSLAATYEVDLWQRLSHLHQAARLDAEAARWDVEALALTLAAQVAEAYFDVVAQRERQGLLKTQLEVSHRFVQLTLTRLANGQATALDVNQQQQQEESLRGLLVQAQAAESLSRQLLLVLLGRPPQDSLPLRTDRLPPLPLLPNPGLPVDLLIHRPDIRAAWLRLVAEDRRTAAAVADLFPRVRLSSLLFYREGEIARLFSESLWSLTASAMQPLFEGGRRWAEIDQAKAQAEAALHRFGQIVLLALREVQDALVLEAHQQELLESLSAQHQIARTSLNLARRRFQQGAENYLRVLTALLSLQQLEQDIIEARRQQFSHRIQLSRALGGPWDPAESVARLTLGPEP